MKRLSLIALVLLFASFISVDFIKKDFGKVNVKVPKDFYELTADDMVSKFGMASLPEGMFASIDNKVTITVTTKKDTLDKAGLTKLRLAGDTYERDVVIERSFRKSSILNEFSDITFSVDTAYNQEKYGIIDFEFDGLLDGKDKKGIDVSSKTYNYIRYIYYKKDTYVINVACPASSKSKWHSTIQEIMKSVEYK